MSKQKILFIINPISGQGRQKEVKKYIKKYLNKKTFSPDITFTEHAGHACEISASAKNHYNYIVAVGGDGSINEVSQGLINSKANMGILPYGSGNGFARHLHIPLQPARAMELLNQEALRTIDTFSLNGQRAVNVAGVGFDAHIAHCFDAAPSRGFGTYIKLSMEEFFTYKARKYEITVDGKTFEREAFLISFANSSQFGNNAYIAPQAKIDDGLLDLVVMKPFPLSQSLGVGYRLFNGALAQSQYVETFRGKDIVVKSDTAMPAHIDGEPRSFGQELRIAVHPQSLSVVAPAV